MKRSPLILSSVDEALAWLHARGVSALTVDSRAVAEPRFADQSVAFIAWPGAARDGRAYVAQALRDGAHACLVEAHEVDAFDFGDDRVAALHGLKAVCGELAHAFYAEPSARLDVVAATGTNGKTSTAWWTAQALAALARPCGVVGTLGVGRPGLGDIESTGLTTPDPITLHATFRRFVDQGCVAAAIEASSIGLEEARLQGTRIAVAQFTNFTQDHLDFHGTMEDYWAAKRALFDWPGLRAAVINLDDPMGESLADGVRARGLDLWTYGLVQMSRLQASGLRQQADGMLFTLIERSEDLLNEVDHQDVHTCLIGDFNVSNLLAVIGALRALGVSLAEAVKACAGLGAVPGRMQYVEPAAPAPAPAPLAVVDYAHTPDALQKTLHALRPLAQARGGRLWCVFGCGGNRDPIKRPMMGASAERGADHLVLTSDNPRNEVPGFILSQILAGIARHEDVDVLEDRGEAIVDALTRCADQDVVLIAGKGHETTQEVGECKLPFSDVQVAQAALQERIRRQCPPMMTLALAHQLLPGSVLTGDPQTVLLRVHSDTRSLQQGDLFVALRGERFDAHDFLPQARQAGAVAALVQRGHAHTDAHAVAGLPTLEVADTRAALGWLAAAWRARFSLPLLAVTGSNGKTTVTQMLASILNTWVAAQGAPGTALATQGNFNNDIGLPLTLLRLRQGLHRCGVVELGMNHPGEIQHLAAIAAPTVALVNNAQREHQEFMAGVEAVARENGAVLQSLSRDGAAVFPADDPHAPLWRSMAAGCRVIDFALEGEAAVTGHAQWQAGSSSLTPHWRVHLNTPAGGASLRLGMAGLHNVRNALAATAAALGAGVPLAQIVDGLEAFEPVRGRSQLHSIESDGQRQTLIDDSYNANPDSVRAAIDMLAGLPGPHWLVLGDMGEVGTQGVAFHEEVGEYAREQDIEQVWTAGELSRHAAQAFGPAARHFNSAAEIVAALHDHGGAPHVASILVKGSRFMKMEQVVSALVGGSHAA